MSGSTTISVRGEAERTVAPDHAAFDCALTAFPVGRDEVLSVGRRGQSGLA